jgi:hypothetical protein
VTFDLSKAQKIAWEVNKANTGNAALTGGDLWIDDVVINGVEVVPPDLCVSCAGAPVTTPSGAKFSDFEVEPYSQNGSGYYWFSYTDVAAGGASAITSGLDGDDILSINGGGRVGNGAAIDFTLGSTFSSGGFSIRPFVGLGTNLTDDAGTLYYDGLADGATGIYFDYQTSATMSDITLEVYDENSYKELRGSGVVHYIKLPGTGGVWRGATVPFTSLMLPGWDEVNALPANVKVFNKAKIMKVQFKFQNNGGVVGALALDNVYFTGATGNFTPTAGLPPAVPTLVSPANLATAVALMPSLSWSPVTGATSFSLQVSTTATFSTIVVNETGLATVSTPISGLSNGTVYYWRVRSSNGQFSDWSTVSSFTTLTPALAAPTLVTPAANATGVALEPRLTWSGVTGATSYSLQISASANFATTVVNLTGIAGTYTDVVGVLSANTVYYWRVKSVDASGESSYSAARAFTTLLEPPATPVLMTPTDNNRTVLG